MQKSDAPLKTNMTLENPHVQEEIHLREVDFPLSYVSFRVRGGGRVMVIKSLTFGARGRNKQLKCCW